MSDRAPFETPARLLIAEDEKLLARAMKRALERRGFEVDLASNGREAKDLLDQNAYAVLVLDLGMPIADGWSVLAHRRSLASRPSVIVITGEDHRDLALQVMRAGASDVLRKPVDPAELVERIDYLMSDAAEHSPQAAEPRNEAASAPKRGASIVVRESTAMHEVLQLADRVARTPTTSALIVGESGVGKEVVASYIHDHSARARGPFVRVNLAALPTTMVEAELFGSVRGAYTGSQQDRVGLMGSASGGTILLDELAEFDIALQPKLLRVLEERRYYPVGSDRQRTLDVRVLCAMNVDPKSAIAAGRLRADLFYRVSTVAIRVPPLRERPADILPLARTFLSQVGATLGRRRLTFSEGAERALAAHRWPGNVRELRNVVERAAIVAPRNDIAPPDLDLEALERNAPSSIPPFGPPSSGKLAALRDEAVADVERERIVEALRSAGANSSRAAEMLGIARSTLWLKMRRYNIPRK
jgi:DNA-binding NtrC family response regulator